MPIPSWIIAISVGANTLTCGPKGLSLCARFYSWKKEGEVRGHIMVFLADSLFWFDKDHCRRSYALRKRL